MAVKQLPKLSELPEPPDRLVGDQERFDVMTFDSLKAQKKMVNEDLNKTFIPKLNEFAVDVNASVNAAAQSERNAAASATTAGNRANEAAASAATAGTKAGEAAKSAAAAKTSETNAAASKSAAAKSATDAATARKEAEAARDEAQDLANVGYASEAKAGLAKVDGKTTQADAGGMIIVKDVAIGGDAADLASKRGQIGNVFVITDANADGIIESGHYLLNGAVSGTPNNTPCFLEVLSTGINNLAQICHQISGQRFTYIRTSPNGGASWNRWDTLIGTRALGDGITVNNGIISVPEYQGATASTPGTSGLVPPAAAGEQELFMTGGGDYKPALTKITDSVASSASDTAASAKAVKSAYDRGSAGITAAGNAQTAANNAQTAAGNAQTAANQALTVANSKAPGGFGLGSLLLSSNLATDLNTTKLTGWYAVNPATLNKPDGVSWGVCQIISGDNNEIHQHLFCTQGIYHRYISITNSVYRAWTQLFNAEYKALYAMGLGAKDFVDAHVSGTPLWLLGLHSDGKLRPFNKGDIQAGYADSANYANRAGSAPANGGTAQTTVAVPNVTAKSYGGTLPSGGTWRIFCFREGSRQEWGIIDAAGGSKVYDNYASIAIRIA